MKKRISFADFSKVELRVGTIEGVEVPQGSKQVYRLTVDLGDKLGRRKVLAGFKRAYREGELKGKQGVFVVNLEPKKIMGEESEGMILAADVDSEPVLLSPDKKVPAGSVVR